MQKKMKKLKKGSDVEKGHVQKDIAADKKDGQCLMLYQFLCVI